MVVRNDSRCVGEPRGLNTVGEIALPFYSQYNVTRLMIGGAEVLICKRMFGGVSTAIYG